MAAITLDGVCKSFGPSVAVRNVSLEIKDGEFLALVGPSGCGKSTLLRIIAGLETQDAGEVLLDGRSIDGLSPKTRDIALVFQSYALYPHMTVAENIAAPLRLRRLNRIERLPLIDKLSARARHVMREIGRDVEKVAEGLAIAHLLARKPRQLSGGQRQRVALGRAMVRRPRAFLMDEPLSNLDAGLRLQMRGELAAIHARLGATFVYVTHDQAEAMTMADRLAVMQQGKLLQVASPREVYDAPADLRVAEFIGAPRINLFPGRLAADGSVESGSLRLPLRARAGGREITIGVRPDALDIARIGNPGWRGKIARFENTGLDVFVHISLAESNRSAVVRTNPYVKPVAAVGSEIVLQPNPQRVLLFDQIGARVGTIAEIHQVPAFA
jgi:multiple sugar transport system ATP-binding protein